MQLTRILLIVILALSSCNKTSVKTTSKKEIKNFLVDKNELELIKEKGQWFYMGNPFNGFAVKYYSNSSLSEKIGYYNGKKEGLAYMFFKDGTVKTKSFYNENVLEGTKIKYYSSGKVFSESKYLNGKKHGIEQVWFENGQLSKKKYLKDGKENGLQQAWLKNGKIYVNYEAKNGRAFGLQRANLCYQLSNEKIIENVK
ncbi:toxin-antitoxin system YwqK family antitoxin [Polaribacter sp.]|uniref:toxin-antitoxin system YwqK family antitoxin n=1 Tax=Polaribacter sp. TaxID=1920175 RepID=UPI0035C7ABB0